MSFFCDISKRMKIVIEECRKIGFKLSGFLSKEGCFVTIVSDALEESQFYLNVGLEQPDCVYIGERKLGFSMDYRRVTDSIPSAIWNSCLHHLAKSSVCKEVENIKSKCLQQLRTIYQHCLDSLPVEYVNLVEHYSPEVKFEIYKMIARGRNGDNLKSLIGRNTGVVLFLLHLKSLEDQRLYADLHGGIQRSEKLRDVLKTSVQAYFCEHFLKESENSNYCGVGYWHLHDSEEFYGIRRRYIMLLGKAGVLVAPSDLKYPPLFHIAPEDIPSSPQQNRMWYGLFAIFYSETFEYVVKRKSDLLILRGAWDFLSRNWERIYNNYDGGRAFVVSLIALCQCKKIILNRKSSFEKIAREFDIDLFLITGLQPEEVAESEIEDVGLGYPDIRLPKAFSDYQDDNLMVRSLVSARDMIREGARMRNCLATLVSKAIACRSYFYFSVSFKGKGLVLEVEKLESGEFVLSSLKGYRNRDVEMDEVGAVLDWLKNSQPVDSQCFRKRGVSSKEFSVREHGIECVYDLLGPYFSIDNVPRVDLSQMRSGSSGSL